MKNLKNLFKEFANDNDKLNELKQILKEAKESKMNYNSLIINLQDEFKDDEGYFLKENDLFTLSLYKEEINHFLTF